MRIAKNFSNLTVICTLLALAATFPGCSRGIKEGLYAVTGAGGKATLIQGRQDDLATFAARFGGISIEPFSSDVGDACPSEFLTALPAAIQKELQYRSRSLTEKLKGVDEAEAGPFFTGPADQTLVLRGRVIQYDTGSIEDKALSPLDEAICRVQFIDAATGTTLAEANLTGRVKSSVRTGPQELANGVAKAVRDLLKPADD